MKKSNFNSISMYKFLRDYHGIANESMLKKLCLRTHKELKILKEGYMGLKLTSVSFQSVTDEDIKTGRIIYVLDKCDNPAPYVNPLRKTMECEYDNNSKRRR